MATKKRTRVAKSSTMSAGTAEAAEASKPAAQIRREIDEALGAEFRVVVAWTEDSQEIAPGQRAWRHDLGERPKFVDVKKPYAAMWANRGTLADLDKARSWVSREYPDSGRAFSYPTSESDPLGRARRDVLR